MKKLLLHITLFLLCLELPAQAILWEKMIDYLPDQEVINSVDETLDTNLIFCVTNSGQSCFVKCNLDGDTLWKKNKSVNTCSNGEYIKQLSNGKLMHFGSKNVDGSCSQANFLFQELSSNGNVINTWSYGAPGVVNYLQAFALLPDGGFLGSGFLGNNFKLSLIKLNNTGDSIWYRTYRTNTLGGSAKVNKKGNYILYGTSADFSSASQRPYFLELTPDGDSINAKLVFIKTGNQMEQMDYGAMIQTSEGDYLFSARIDTSDTMGNILSIYTGVVLMDSLFNIKWRVYLKPAGSQSYYTSKVLELKDSSYIVLMNNYSPFNQNFYLYKISKTGQVLNQKTFTSSVCSTVILNEMKLLSDTVWWFQELVMMLKMLI